MRRFTSKFARFSKSQLDLQEKADNPEPGSKLQESSSSKSKSKSGVRKIASSSNIKKWQEVSSKINKWEEVLRRMLPAGAPLPDEDHLDYSFTADYEGPLPGVPSPMNEIAGKTANDLQIHRGNPGKVEDESILKFLDSMDDYLTLMDSLFMVLRQGWLELASARHSMGTSRINSSVFDHKAHSAATTLRLDPQKMGSGVEQPHFELRKWESSCCPKEWEGKLEEDKLMQSLSTGLQIHNMRITPESNGSKENRTENNGSPYSVDDPVQKERLRSLSMFGALFSPKLRDAQISFETALETLTEMANARASLHCSYELVCKEITGTK